MKITYFYTRTYYPEIAPMANQMDVDFAIRTYTNPKSKLGKKEVLFRNIPPTFGKNNNVSCIQFA